MRIDEDQNGEARRGPERVQLRPFVPTAGIESEYIWWVWDPEDPRVLVLFKNLERAKAFKLRRENREISPEQAAIEASKMGGYVFIRIAVLPGGFIVFFQPFIGVYFLSRNGSFLSWHQSWRDAEDAATEMLRKEEEEEEAASAQNIPPP